MEESQWRSAKSNGHKLYTIRTLKNLINKYFKDFFDTVEFYSNEHSVIMKGERKGCVYEHQFNLVEWNCYRTGVIHHVLESIKGNFVRKEELILLEHQRQEHWNNFYNVFNIPTN
jgi:hypothetical protein